MTTQAPCKQAVQGLAGSMQEAPPLHVLGDQYRPDAYLLFFLGSQCRGHVLCVVVDLVDMANMPWLGKSGGQSWTGSRGRDRGSRDSNVRVDWNGLGPLTDEHAVDEQPGPQPHVGH